ncbi:MAG TPA: UbiA family prenyltransferase [Bacteroidales bacterium]|nr:UbiA family prenyltransferase [Bacteroidales bacterium]
MEKAPLWPDKDTLLHLRFPFSYFLMPVFMFALCTATGIYWPDTLLAFFILHFLIFPSSNGYNSFHDRDESSIGALRYPPPVSLKLFYATLVMDIVAVVLGIFISAYFALLALLFILVSRAYSYRPLRLKRFPVISFVIVSTFQGGLVYLMSTLAISNHVDLSFITSGTLICMVIATLFIGSVYPLTQIYQHVSDKNDGVISLSYKLGYVGTFIFSAILFLTATYFVYVYFNSIDHVRYFSLFMIVMLPVVTWFVVWFVKVLKNVTHANYDNTMFMNLVTASCMNLFFLFITINRYAEWY